MELKLNRISDGEEIDVVVPSILILPETDRSGSGTVEKKYPRTDKSALQRWAFISGYIVPAKKKLKEAEEHPPIVLKEVHLTSNMQRMMAMHRMIAEAQVRVKAHQRKDKETGKIEDVDAFVRTTKDGKKAKLTLTDRVYDPTHIRPVETDIHLSKTQIGKVGEQLAMQMKGGIPVNQFIGTEKNNLAFDVINTKKRILYEVKAGTISNERSAQKWRLTKGEPSKKEKEFLKRASPAVKLLYNKGKEGRILARKLALQQEVERITGHKYRTKTLTFILHPDKRVADSYEFNGLHPIIRWHSKQAEEGYRRSVKY